MKINFLFIIIILTLNSYCQSIGPGGVGLSNELSLWLDASTISISNGSTISSWDDISGNNNHFSQNSAPLKPTYSENSIINSKPAIIFSNDNLFSSSISSLNTSNVSWFIVSQTSATGLQVLFRSNYSSGSGTASQSAQLLGLYSSQSGGVIQYVRASNGALKGNTSTFSSSPHIHSSIWSNSSFSSYKDNALESSISTGNVSPSGHNLICLGANSADPSINYLSYSGEVAEFIMFNISINSAQKNIIHNYLSSKYNITISDDKYSYDANYGNEVSGIGREDINNQQLESKGRGIIQFQAASLDNSDYLFWGHDNGNLTSSSTGIPPTFPSSTGKILERVWRVSETGESGDLTLTVDLTGIGFGAENDYKLLIDSDGDFSSGATEIDGVYNSDLVVFNILSNQISDGDYFTIGNTSIEIKSISSGNWNNTSIWDCSCEPTVGNDITIEAAHNVNVSSSAVANNLLINGTLTLSDLIDVEGNLTNNGTISSNGSRIFLAGNWDNSSGSYTYSDGDSVTFDGSSVLSTISGDTDWGILTINNSNGVTINSGNQNIFSKLNIQNGTLTTGGLLTLKSNANGTAQMDNIESGAISGNITIERYLDLSAKDGWREVTSPLQGSTLLDWQSDGVIFSGFAGSDYPTFGFVSAYTYSEPNASGNSINGWTPASNISNSVNANNGHRIYFDSLVYTLSTSGTPNTGTQTINVTQNGGAGIGDQENGWNLIGNPYPSTIDWSRLSVSDKNNIENSIWIFNQTAGNYGVWNGASGTLGVDNQIASSQAFWVHATASNGSITINEDDKVNDDKAFIRSFTNTEDLIINLSGNINSYFDELVIKRNDSATPNFNPELDLLKLFTDIPDEAPSLYSTVDDSLDLSVNCIDKSNNNEIFFHAKAGNLASGIYTLNFSIPDLFMDKGCIFLTDLFVDSVIDLRLTNNYTFSSNDSINPRFKINIYRDYDVNTIDASCYSTSDGQVLISGDSISGSNFNLLDSNGVMINTMFANSHSILFDNLFSGFYTISTDMSIECYDNISEIHLESPPLLESNFSINSDSLFFGSQESAQLQLTNQSLGHNFSEWNFGDGYFSNETHPVHFYSDSGNYTVSLTVMDTNINNCNNTFERLIVVIDSTTMIGNQEINKEIDLNVINSNLIISSLNNIKTISLKIFNSAGQIVYDEKINNLNQKNYVTTIDLKVGNIYIARVYLNNKPYIFKFFID